MQLISMNALCDNDSTLEEEESSFSGPIRPPKPSCSFPSFGCRVLGSTVPVPTRLDHRSRGGIWPCVLCRPIRAGGHAIDDLMCVRDTNAGQILQALLVEGYYFLCLLIMLLLQWWKRFQSSDTIRTGCHV